MADIDTIRTPGNWSDIFLIIDAPDTIYTARATGAVAEADWSISFDGGSGTLGNCLEDMTLLVGSTSGGWERGIARLRKAPIAGKFYIGADPSIVCVDNDYLTVLNDFPPMARHPVGALLDVDIAYSDQFSAFVPIPWCNGRVRVIKAGETTQFDAGFSWVPDSTISAYAWTFTGATATTDTNTATPTATYDNSGRFRFSLLVTATNGKTYTGYGFVFVLGVNLAAEADFLFDDVDHTSEAGGRYRITMLDRPTIKDGARAVLFAEDWYNGLEQSFGPVAGMKNILLDGRIVGETILRRPETERVEFEIVGLVGFLSGVAALPSGLVDTALPDDSGTALPAWSKITGLTVEKGLHYLATLRSTIARCMDISVEDWTWACPKLIGTSESIFGQLSEYAGRSALSVRSDRCGRLWCQRDTQLYPTASRTADIPVVVTLQDGDWQDTLSITRRQRGDIAMAEAEGEIFAANRLTPVGGRSPGDQPGHSGGKDTGLNELYVSSEDTVLELAGLQAGSKNQEIEIIQATLAHNNRLMDTAPRMFVNAVVDSDTLRCIPRRVAFRRDARSGFLHTEIELEPEGSQWPAVPILYPGENAPPEENPTEPEIPPIPGGEEEEPEEPSAGDAVVATETDVRTSADFDQASPAWATESPSPTGIVDMSLAPWSNDILFYCTETKIIKTSNLTTVGAATWETVFDVADNYPAVTNWEFRQIKCTNTEGLIYAVALALVSGDTDYTIFFVRSSSNGVTWQVVPTGITNTPKAYTVTTNSGVSADDGGQTVTRQTHERIGTDTNEPWGIAWRVSGSVGAGSQFTQWPAAPTPTQINNFGGTNYTTTTMAVVAINSSVTSATVEGWFDEYFGGVEGVAWRDWLGAGSGSMPNDEARILIAVLTAAATPLTIDTFAFWKETDPGSAVFDFARTDNDWVYIGSETEIYKSIDGGWTWTVLSVSYGADDILVDPQAAGVIYFWATDGTFSCMVAGQVQALPTLTSIRYRRHTRIAKQLNGGKIWTIDGGGILKEHDLGAWTSRVTGVIEGCSLRAYLGSPVVLVYLDSTKIWYSTTGSSFTNKTGGWAGFANPIAIHLMAEIV